MKPHKPKTNWIIDALLFAAFVVSFFLDCTGLALHQLLGAFVGALATYHLLAHWAWVKAITAKFAKRANAKARLYYVLDVAVLLGLLGIILTGLAISTWLDLPLGNYLAWRNAHVWASICTMLLVVLKIGLHWRWIVSVARRHILPQPKAAPQPGLAPVAVETTRRRLDRRSFLVLMGGVSLAGLLAIRNAGESMLAAAPAAGATGAATPADARHTEATSPVTATEAPALATPAPAGATPESAIVVEGATDQVVAAATATALPTVAPTATVVAQDCVVRCPRGCSYPGSCRKYIDANNNRKCDLGECL